MMDSRRPPEWLPIMLPVTTLQTAFVCAHSTARNPEQVVGDAVSLYRTLLTADREAAVTGVPVTVAVNGLGANASGTFMVQVLPPAPLPVEKPASRRGSTLWQASWQVAALMSILALFVMGAGVSSLVTNGWTWTLDTVCALMVSPLTLALAWSAVRSARPTKGR